MILTPDPDSEEIETSGDYQTIQKELASVKLSRSILNDRFEEIVGEIEAYREIRYVAEKPEEKNRPEHGVNKK